MSMNGEPVPPEGLDYIKNLEQWLEQYPNDVMVRSKMADLQRDPRYAEPDEPDDIMPQVPELADFPVPPRLKKYIDATRIVAGASVPTSAACIGATFNLLATEDIDVQSRANAPHPSGLYFVVGSESGWRKSASFRETMKGHVEADERVEALHHEADSDTEEGMEFRVKGFSPRALRQDFTIEALLSRLWKARRTMAVANSDASSLLGGWSFRRDNLSRSLSHFVSLWDGDPTSIDRRNPETPEIFFYQRRLTAPDHGPSQRHRRPAVQPSRGQRVHRQVPAQHGPGEAEASGRHLHVLPGCPGYHCRHARAGHTAAGRTRTPMWNCCEASSADR